MNTPAHIPTIEPAELTVEEEMQRALARVSLTDQKIAEMVSLAASVPNVTDPDTEQQAVKALKEVNKWSILGRKNIASIHQRFVDAWKLSGRVSKEIESRLREPELLIEAKLAPYRAEQQYKRDKEAAAIEAMREQRKNDLLALKYLFVPGPPEHRYELEGVGVSVRDIIEFDELTWRNRFGELRMHGEAVAARIAEEERLRQEELARLEQQRQEQEAREQELARREAEMRQREQEAEEAVRKAVESGRLAELGVLGIDTKMYYQQHFLGESIQPPLAEYEPMEWSVVLARAKELVARIVKHEQELEERRKKYEAEAQEKAAREALIRERVEKLKAAGWVEATELSDGSVPKHNVPSGTLWIKCHDDDWYIYGEAITTTTEADVMGAVQRGQAELARRAAVEEERQNLIIQEQKRIDHEAAQAREREAAMAMSDMEKWEKWMEDIKASAPELRSEIGKKSIKTVMKYLSEITPGVLRDLKP